MRATVFEVDVKPVSFEASGGRPGLVAIVLAMALLAYMPTAACTSPGVSGGATDPGARVGVTAVRRGGDCLAIDAEGSYEGRYAAADRYIRAPRAGIGSGFPLSLAGFPYVDYHSSFPCSVFLGPEGATFNQPQMHWKAIDTSVRAVYEHTCTWNALGTTTAGAVVGYQPVVDHPSLKRGSGVSRALPASRPVSASLPAQTYEIDPGPAP